MKVLYTSFVNGDDSHLSQRIIDTGDMDLLTFVASEAGLSYEDLMGTPECPSPVDVGKWLHNEHGLCINDYDGECIESYFILPS